MSTTDKKAYISIYENRWWLLALFFVLFLAYLPAFQYNYLVQDDYSEVYNQLGFTQFLIWNGRVFQYFIEKFLHYILVFSGYKVVFARFFSFLVFYCFASVVFLFLVSLKLRKVLALLLTAFAFTTMMFSVLIQWLDLAFINFGNLYAGVIFYIAWFYYDKYFFSSHKLSSPLLFVFLIFISLLFSFSAMFSQSSIFVPLLFVVLSLLFTQTRIVNLSHRSNNTYEIINVYQREIFIIVSVVIGSIFYLLFWKLEIFLFKYLHEHGIISFAWNRNFGRDLGYDSGLLSFVWSKLVDFINYGSYNSFAYFNTSNKYLLISIMLFVLAVIFYALYKEIFVGSQDFKQRLNYFNLAKWFLVMVCIFGALPINLLELTFRTGYVFSISILFAFVYSLNVVFNLDDVFRKFSYIFNVDVKVFINNVSIVLIAIVVVNSAVVNNFMGLVYSNFVEQIYVKSTLLNEIHSHPNADTIYLKSSFEDKCYYGTCYGAFALKFSNGYNSFYHSIVEYNLELFGLAGKFNVVKDTDAESKESEVGVTAKLDMNRTIIIDMQGLHEAFLATYDKDSDRLTKR